MYINIWLPVSVFKVNYEIGSGRPVSGLDRLIMEAIQNEKEQTIEQLANLFHLPTRIIVEITVTLARSNWITVNPDTGGFVVTEYGNCELESGNQPRYLNVFTKEETIVKECILGHVCLADKVTIKKPIEGEYSIDSIIDSRIMTIEEARSVLKVNPNTDEWIRFIDTPKLVSRGHRAIRVEVDLMEQKVSFLPDSWKSKLEPVLIEKTRYLFTS